MTTPKPEVFAYIRVSSHEQATEDKFGMAVQLAAIQKYCATNNFELKEDHIFRETETGTNDEREKLAKIFATAEKNKALGIVTHIVCMKMDRLSRSLPGLLKQTAKALVYGVVLHSCEPGENSYLNLDTRSIDDFDPSEKFVRYILMATVEYDKDLINKRFRGGKKQKKAKGGFIGGKPPFGYRIDVKTRDIVPDDSKTSAVRRVLMLHSQCLSITQIAMSMEHSHQGLQKWTRLSVKRILDKRALYEKGEYHGKNRPELVIL